MKKFIRKKVKEFLSKELHVHKSQIKFAKDDSILVSGKYAGHTQDVFNSYC